MEQLSHNIECCQACGLAAGCRRKVPGQGDPHAPLMLIGEGPGRQEDLEGLAFVGPAGQLLTRMLAAISLPRDRVYICNVVKCRPPNNRQPTPEEMAACLPHLRGQVALVRPRVILLLGATAVAAVLGPQERITRCRGGGLNARVPASSQPTTPRPCCAILPKSATRGRISRACGSGSSSFRSIPTF